MCFSYIVSTKLRLSVKMIKQLIDCLWFRITGHVKNFKRSQTSVQVTPSLMTMIVYRCN